MGAATLVTLVALAAARRAKPVPATDCFVTSTAVDGTEEKRDCFILSEEETKPGSKGRFESCTQ